VVGGFSVANLACDLGDRRVRSTASLRLCERSRSEQRARRRGRRTGPRQVRTVPRGRLPNAEYRTREYLAGRKSKPHGRISPLKPDIPL
jgi:hypothetical protein